MQVGGQMVGGMGSEMASTGDPQLDDIRSERMMHEQHLMMKIK